MRIASESVRRILTLLLIATAAWWPAQAAELSPPVVEPPLELSAADIVPKALMKGEVYRIESSAVNDGYVNTYTLVTDWGKVQAVSDYRLRVRIQEANALKALDEMSRAGVFGDSLVEGALAPVRGAVDLVTEPVETVSGAAEGLGRWFGNIADSVSSDDPHQEGALSAAVGWAATKRAFAVELGVDPYTDWKPLQDALVSVGQAAFAGGITASVAMGAVTEGTALKLPVLVLGLSHDMNQILIDNPPEKLTEMNRKALGDLGLGGDAVSTFMDNHNYTPLEKLQLVAALQRMKDADGLEFLLASAAAAPDKAVARYTQQRAEMMANFHTKIAPTTIIQLKEFSIQRSEDARIVGVFPLDYVAWTADLAVIVKAMSEEVAQISDAGEKEMWFEGSASPDARKGMEAHGWTVKERVELLMGAPLQDVDDSGAIAVSPAVRAAGQVIQP